MNIKSKGLTLNVDIDIEPLNPRTDYDHLGRMYCWHRNYNLGDGKPYKTSQDFWEDEELQDEIFVKLTVYAYDHSGITISSSPFNCPWDSGKAGVMFATKTNVLKEYGDLSEETKQKVTKRLDEEIKTYDEYLKTDYYYFSIEDEEGAVIESLGSFSGNAMNDVLSAMKENVSADYGFLFDKMIAQQNQATM